jgi:hypothetical protein
MNRSVEDLFRSIDSSVHFEKRLLDLVKGTDQEKNDSNEVAEEGREKEKDIEALLIEEVPKSFEEIYQLSSKNRKKNKEKKRNRGEVDHSIESEGLSSVERKQAILASLEENEGSHQQFVTKDGFDYKQFFTSSVPDSVDISVDGTVSYYFPCTKPRID